MVQSAPHSPQPHSRSPLKDAVAREYESLIGPPLQAQGFLEAYLRVSEQIRSLPLSTGPESSRRLLRVDTEQMRVPYAGPTPPTQVHAGAEGNALRGLLAYGKDPCDLIAYWVTGAGIPFAVLAIAAAAEYQFFTFDEWVACARCLHGHLLAANQQTQAEVRRTVGAWRAGCNLEQSALLSSIFLDPAWIDADLCAAAVSGPPALPTMMSAAALSCASDMEALAKCLGARRVNIYDVEEGDTLGLTLLARHGDAAEAPLLAWMDAAAEAGLWATVVRLVGAFAAIGRFQHVVAPLLKAMRDTGALRKSRGKVAQPCRAILFAHADASLAWLAEQPGTWHRLLRAQMLFELGGGSAGPRQALPEPLRPLGAAEQDDGPLAALVLDAGLLSGVPGCRGALLGRSVFRGTAAAPCPASLLRAVGGARHGASRGAACSVRPPRDGCPDKRAVRAMGRLGVRSQAALGAGGHGSVGRRQHGAPARRAGARLAGGGWASARRVRARRAGADRQ